MWTKSTTEAKPHDNGIENLPSLLEALHKPSDGLGMHRRVWLSLRQTFLFRIECHCFPGIRHASDSCETNIVVCLLFVLFLSKRGIFMILKNIVAKNWRKPCCSLLEWPPDVLWMEFLMALGNPAHPQGPVEVMLQTSVLIPRNSPASGLSNFRNACSYGHYGFSLSVLIVAEFTGN